MSGLRRFTVELDLKATAHNEMASVKLFPSPLLLRTFSYQHSRTSLHSFSRFPSAPFSRCFSNTSRRAAKSIPSAPKPATRPNIAASTEETLKFAGRRPAGFGKLERKVAKEGQVVLYKAPSQRTYILGAYGMAAFCFAYAVYNSNITFRDPKVPLPVWQKSLFGGVCIIMSIMGTVFLFKTNRLVKTITAVNSNGKTMVRFTVRNFIPFRKPVEFDAVPRQIVFSRRVVVSPESIGPDAADRSARNEAVSKVSFFRAPFKKISFVLWRAFCSVRRLFTQEGFVLIEVEGRKGDLRMDLEGFISNDLFLVGNPVHVKFS
ncbi:hypothetical protein DTO166G4_863 [Paecilomyces variotii]|nr:hypothetical protein DTO166G4_863 [Paecilomyces variotii]KAJ9237834.1 hypothetical protein DTO169E5_5005 [Paecilomyces variotii]KAJ9243120.1 hypothetical protein DTO166G5_224 [Paecilomyces variotii]KAJ9310290.1 hypothetical protein DTO217A2_69 [Paecilomyces variotii]KAJ9389031.1 hypothetical protein DTO063F5_2191 [Paecilomyces variotii]